MSRRGDWQRVSKRRRCPVCGRADWCLYAGPADAPTAVICARVESSKRAGEAGWLHVLRNDGPVWTPWRRNLGRAIRMMTTETADGRPDLGKLAESAAKWCGEHPEALARFARSLGLSVTSLQRLAVGYSPPRRAWSFPMTDAAGNVLGIRLRSPSGRKWSVRGGKEGLFVPSGMEPGGRLLVCEGPTDTAALLDLGFPTVGRPSCMGGVRHVVELVQRLHPAEAVIVADHDEPGQRGADWLASSLAAYVPVLRVIRPPDGLKDARAWRQAGGTAADVEAAIEAAEPRRLAVTVQVT